MYVIPVEAAAELADGMVVRVNSAGLFVWIVQNTRLLRNHLRMYDVREITGWGNDPLLTIVLTPIINFVGWVSYSDTRRRWLQIVRNCSSMSSIEVDELLSSET